MGVIGIRPAIVLSSPSGLRLRRGWKPSSRDTWAEATAVIVKIAFEFSHRREERIVEMPRVYNSIVINAPIETVWKRIADFHDFSWAPSVITRCENVSDKGGTAVGAKRLLNGRFLDTLI